MNMKKITALLTTAFMTMSFAACGGSTESPSGTEESTSESVSETVTEPAAPEIDKGTMRGLNAKELVADMKIGWNLGNSLDSVGRSETAWGNPATKKEMIDDIREEGFDVLRVPVTWFGHIGDAPEYKVDDDFMDRVNEVVDYGIANGMYVILDTHHEENGWMKMTSSEMPEIEPKFEALWRQIAEHFKDYGDKLVFEGINEARLVGSPAEWQGGNKDGRECVNKMNRIFFDTVRATGGNNEKRLLLIAPYGHSTVSSAMSALEFGTFDDYTGVAVHSYAPYGFTYNVGESWETFIWDGHQNSDIDGTFNSIFECILSQDMPVVLTECGAQEKKLEDGSSNSEEVIKWAQYFFGTAKEYGIPCVVWDNNQFNKGNEFFGLYDRVHRTWYRKDVADAIIAAAK